MKKFFLLQIAALCFFPCLSQNFVNTYSGTPGFSRIMESYNQAMAKKAVPVKVSPANKKSTLPPEVDNSGYKYFEGIGNQFYILTCQQFSGIKYGFEYEVDRARDLSAHDSANQYPEKYTFNYMNGGGNFDGVSFFYSWDVLKRQGHPTADVYPSNDSLMDIGWMSGYDRYYSAMHNRIRSVGSINVSTDEGIQTLKQYLFDHLDGSPTGGFAVFGASSNFYGGNLIYIPPGNPEEGKGLVWGLYPEATHGMTIVGYNDSVRYDFNGDGKFTNDIDLNGDGVINPIDYEKGAYRIANSYGKEWEDSGFVYILYRALAQGYYTDSAGYAPFCGAWNNSVFTIDPITDYEPLLTMRVRLFHTRRYLFAVRAGISADTASLYPEHIMEFPIWNFQGGDHPVNIFQHQGPDSEAGFDITPLLSYAEPGKPCRLFMIIEEKDPENNGEGALKFASFLNYPGAHETIAFSGDEPLVNNGLTIKSAVVTPSFSKVNITSNELPAYQSQPYNVQLNAENGKQPYSWSLMHPAAIMETDSAFPSPGSVELQYENEFIPYQAFALPFSFPFCGKTYDTIYVNAYGFICFTPDEIPYHYLVDQEELLRNNKVISVLYSNDWDIKFSGSGMWMKEDAHSVTINWKASLINTSVIINFALRMHDDGRFEFLYDDCTAYPVNFASLAGFSAGDDKDNDLKTIWNLSDFSGKGFLYDPDDFPEGIALSDDGMLSLNDLPDGKIYDITACVSDAGGIRSFKTFNLTGDLDITASFSPKSAMIGENISADIILKNRGSNNISDLELKLIGSDRNVVISDSTENVTSLDAGATVTLNDAFSFSKGQYQDDGTSLCFRINAKSGSSNWEKDVHLPFSAPEVTCRDIRVNDGVDESLDPGETAYLNIILENEGSADISSMTASLSAGDTSVRILSAAALQDLAIPAHGTIAVSYLLSASRYLMQGDTTKMEMLITDDKGYSRSTGFDIISGRINTVLLNLSKSPSAIVAIDSALMKLGIGRHLFTEVPDMRIYRNAFVVMGNRTVTTRQAASLDSFLIRNNHVYLEGTLAWKFSSTFLNRFHYNADDTAPTFMYKQIEGVNGTFTEGMGFRFTGSAYSSSYEYLPVAPSYTILRTPEQKTVQIACEEENYKTIGSIMSFSGLSDSTDLSSKKTLMEKYLKFFGVMAGGTKAYFHTDKMVTEKGGVISFFDDSFDGITSWHWSFPGGNPSVSDLKNPVVAYPEPGVYDVSLSVSGTSGSADMTKKEFIHVLSPAGIVSTVNHKELLVFPNPADEFVRIKLPDGCISASVFLEDLYGRKVAEWKYFNGMTIGIGKIPAGIYQLNAMTNQGLLKSKLVKK